MKTHNDLVKQVNKHVDRVRNVLAKYIAVGLIGHSGSEIIKKILSEAEVALAWGGTKELTDILMKLKECK